MEWILFLLVVAPWVCILFIIDAMMLYHLNQWWLRRQPVDEEYCMCGEHIAAHHWANHSPVSIEMHRRDQINQMTVDFPYEWKDL